MVNSPGTIDSDYRGEVQLAVINLGAEPVTIRHGDRIAQMVVQRVSRVRWDEVEELPGIRARRGRVRPHIQVT